MRDFAIAIALVFVMFLVLIILRYRDARADDIDPTACRSMQTHPPGEPWRYGMRISM